MSRLIEKALTEAEAQLARRLRRIHKTDAETGKQTGSLIELALALNMQERANARVLAAQEFHAEQTQEAYEIALVIEKLTGENPLPEGFTVYGTPIETADPFPLPVVEFSGVPGVDEDTGDDDDDEAPLVAEAGPRRVNGRFAKAE